MNTHASFLITRKEMGAMLFYVTLNSNKSKTAGQQKQRHICNKTATKWLVWKAEVVRRQWLFSGRRQSRSPGGFFRISLIKAKSGF